MYAVIRTGGKQYRVAPGESVRVERLPGEVGDPVELPDVLLVAGEGEPRVGTPRVPGAVVHARIAAQGRHRKIVVFKAKRRKNYRRKQGHRQEYTELLIDRIEGV